MKKCLLILLIVFFVSNLRLFATTQYPDILVDGNDTVAIFCNPLEQYLDKKNKRKFCSEKLNWTSTACYRGYQAIWTIQNDSLFLLKVRIGCGESEDKYFDLKKEFKTDKKVFANWFTGEINSPRGDLLQYVHDGYASIFEKEKIFYLSNGKIDSLSNNNYLVYDINRLKPSTRFLSDTIRKIIISHIDKDKVKGFPDSLACSINIRFNENGLIDSIYNEWTYDGLDILEDYIYSVATKTLINLPPLMKVTHKRYYPPTIGIFFSGHCVKYPEDKEYGCKD